MTAVVRLSEADRIGRLRVQGAPGQRTALRLSLERVLDHTDLRPACMPPAAILIVRRLTDPLPRQLAPGLRNPPIDAAWERAVQQRLAELYSKAARPGRGTVPADAEAVVFADDSELLVGLALDLASGAWSRHWWWKSLFDCLSLPLSSALAILFCERASAVPAVLAELARRGRADEVIGALTPRDAETALRVLCRTHGVDALASPAGSVAEREIPPNAAHESTDLDRPPGRAELRVSPRWPDAQLVEAPLPPWVGFLPPAQAVHLLPSSQTCFLGVALTLHHRPALARSSAFAAALAQWRQTPVRKLSLSQRGARSDSTMPASPSLRFRGSDPPDMRPAAEYPRGSSRPPEICPVEQPINIEAQCRTVDPIDSVENDDPGSREAAPPAPKPGEPPMSPKSGLRAGPVEPQREATTIAEQHETEPTPQALRVPVPTAASAGSPQSEPLIALPTAESFPEGGIETGLAGVFILINLMGALDLPTCFEADWHFDSRLGTWSLLDALGRGLLPPDARWLDDPVWPALAQLSQRAENELLGADLPRRRDFRLPPGWRAPMPELSAETLHWAVGRDAMRLWSSAGYVLSEIAMGSRGARDAVRDEARRHGCNSIPRRGSFEAAPVTQLSGPLATIIDRPLRRWLELSLPFIHRRLALALGIEPGTGPLETTLLARTGRLFVTATHVDLVMPLDCATLPVRLSGLDRNPGWLSEFGRVVLFHFE
jgi:hypothetical protein